MWIDIVCPECKGKGQRVGIASHDERGNYYEGTMHCFRCNGEGKEEAWIEPAVEDRCGWCDGAGSEPGSYGAQVCSRCFGKGREQYHDGWREL